MTQSARSYASINGVVAAAAVDAIVAGDAFGVTGDPVVAAAAMMVSLPPLPSITSAAALGTVFAGLLTTPTDSISPQTPTPGGSSHRR